MLNYAILLRTNAEIFIYAAFIRCPYAYRIAVTDKHVYTTSIICFYLMWELLISLLIMRPDVYVCNKHKRTISWFARPLFSIHSTYCNIPFYRYSGYYDVTMNIISASEHANKWNGNYIIVIWMQFIWSFSPHTRIGLKPNLNVNYLGAYNTDTFDQ